MVRVLAFSASLYLTALLTRGIIWGAGALPHPSGFVRLAGFAWDDAMVVAGFALCALAALLLADRLPRCGLVRLAYLSLVVNVFAIRHTGQPISAQLLSQPDWFRGPTPRAAVAGPPGARCGCRAP
ncbi:hypothetical protein [Alteraurantiacibacter buctensis]|uniref:Uncharacterized protein n=1 Tax=Alteraurantiacibacter buctensis TaxID=1503981 RepID=A0A844Z1V3_9SPHN|nr:hypothetical protein [Alteraurantiacibacter buctensis]MXO72437.1 hypothetical protein [Alteraurantiacibacter buctensis]